LRSGTVCDGNGAGSVRLHDQTMIAKL